MQQTTEVFCSRIKLKPGSMPRVQEWARTMTERKAEAMATLANEAVWEEVVFLERSDGGEYLVIFMRADDMEHARQVGRTSTAAIDQYHQQFKRDIIESSTELELVLDLQRRK